MITEKLKEIRESQGLTQAEIASRLGMERSNYARLENRGESITISQLKSICQALDVSVLEVIDDDYRVTKPTTKKDNPARVAERKTRELKTENGLLRNFANWVTMLFREDFDAMKQVLLKDVQENDSAEESDFRTLGKKLFAADQPYLFWALFMARSGFISEKWFIEAYKRSARKVGTGTNTAESINWVNGVLEYISEDEGESE